MLKLMTKLQYFINEQKDIHTKLSTHINPCANYELFSNDNNNDNE